MNLRPAFEHLQSTFHEGRIKLGWAPGGCIDCPRKGGPIANDRCLEYQAADRCLCPNAARVSVRDTLAAEDDEQAPGRPRRARRKRRSSGC